MHAGHPKRLLETVLRDGRYGKRTGEAPANVHRFWASVTVTAICNELGTLIGFAKVTRAPDRGAASPRSSVRPSGTRRSERARKRGEVSVVGRRSTRLRDLSFLDPEGHVLTWNAAPSASRAIAPTNHRPIVCPLLHPGGCGIAGLPTRLLRRATEWESPGSEGLRMRKDGTRFWASVVLTALRDKSGSLRGFAKVTRDITGRKHAERRMALLADASRLLGESLDWTSSYSRSPRMAVPNFADGVVNPSEGSGGRASSRFVPRHQPGDARCRSRSPSPRRLPSGRSRAVA